MDEWKGYDDIIKFFCATSGMEVRITQYLFISHKADKNILDDIFIIISCQVANMVDGFKYLCYCLKPTSYKIRDSLWLVEKFEKIIG